MAEVKKETPLKKVMIIVAKGTIEDIYAGLVMANGAVMEGIETKLFFTFLAWMPSSKKGRTNPRLQP
jgi:peroxiredoxin family protein